MSFCFSKTDCSIKVWTAGGRTEFIMLPWGPAEGQFSDNAPSELPHEHLSWVNNSLSLTRSLFALHTRLVLGKRQNMQNIQIIFQLLTALNVLTSNCSLTCYSLYTQFYSKHLLGNTQKTEKKSLTQWK